MTDEAEPEYLTLKWGSLKSWNFTGEKTRELLSAWSALGSCASAMFQHDTLKQKQIICDLIDAGAFETVYLDWDGKEVSKQEAKDYVMNYGKKEPA